MSCVRGCCLTQAEHYRSLAVAHPDRGSLQKVTTDDHGTHEVKVTEHYADRQDVTVSVPRVRMALNRATTEQKD